MTDQLDLDAIEARANALNDLGIPGATWTASPRGEKSVFPPEMAHVVEDVLRTGSAVLRSSVGVFGDERHAKFVAHAREDVRALVAEVRRLQAELADFSCRVNELESRLCECEPVREHDDYRRPAFYQHEPHCPVNAEQPTPAP